MNKYNNYYTNENQKGYRKGGNDMFNEEEKFSRKMYCSKWWMRASTIRNNRRLDNFLTDIYYDESKRRNLIEGVDRGLTSVESIKNELTKEFELLTNTEKQALGAGLSLILAEEGYSPVKKVPIFDCFNIKNASQFGRS